jgi:hypothetical protein
VHSGCQKLQYASAADQQIQSRVQEAAAHDAPSASHWHMLFVDVVLRPSTTPDTWLGTSPHISLFCEMLIAYRLCSVPRTGGTDPVSLLLAKYLKDQHGVSATVLAPQANTPSHGSRSLTALAGMSYLTSRQEASLQQAQEKQ